MGPRMRGCRGCRCRTSSWRSMTPTAASSTPLLAAGEHGLRLRRARPRAAPLWPLRRALAPSRSGSLRDAMSVWNGLVQRSPPDREGVAFRPKRRRGPLYAATEGHLTLRSGRPAEAKGRPASGMGGVVLPHSAKKRPLVLSSKISADDTSHSMYGTPKTSDYQSAFAGRIRRLANGSDPPTASARSPPSR
jgi:hypothetical protein